KQHTSLAAPQCVHERRSSDLGCTDGKTKSSGTIARWTASWPASKTSKPARSKRCLTPSTPSALMESGPSPPILDASRLCGPVTEDRKSTRLNSSHVKISYDVF